MAKFDEIEFLKSVKTILQSDPNMGVNAYMWRIYGDEQISHDIIVATHGKEMKLFKFSEIDEAIAYWWNPIRDFYL